MEVNKAADKTNSLLRRRRQPILNFVVVGGQFVWSRTIRLRRIDQVLGRMKVAGPPNSPPARSLDRPTSPTSQLFQPRSISTCTEISVDTVKVEIALEPQTQRAPEGINYN
eukprot:scaffold4217_cov78-Skeletonema_marinoi.AAC.1